MTKDVVIAGGGPTGLMLACELRLSGIQTLVLEQLSKPTGFSKALGLQSRTMEMLDHRGLLERFSAGTVAPPFVNFGMFPLDLRTLDFPHPHGLFIGQARVEELLGEHANEVGTEIRRGHEITDVSQDVDAVTVELRGPSGGYEIRASYLIGCDGGHSIVRKRAGFSFPGMEPSLVGRMGDVRVAPGGLELLKRAVPQLGGKDFGIVRTETGNFAIVPLGAGIHRVAAVEWDPTPVERDAPMSLDELRAAIRRVAGINLPMSDPVWLSRPRDRSRPVDRYLSTDLSGLDISSSNESNSIWGDVASMVIFTMGVSIHLKEHANGEPIWLFRWPDFG